VLSKRIELISNATRRRTSQTSPADERGLGHGAVSKDVEAQDGEGGFDALEPGRQVLAAGQVGQHAAEQSVRVVEALHGDLFSVDVGGKRRRVRRHAAAAAAAGGGPPGGGGWRRALAAKGPEREEEPDEVGQDQPFARGGQ
jgi:hypothetical protein